MPGAQQWVNDLPNDANKKFVADYRKKNPGLSPSFYGAQSYDAANLDQQRGGGREGRHSARRTRCARRWRRRTSSPCAATSSTATNHIPIQNFYLQDVVKDADGKLVLKTVATIVENNQDRVRQQVPR